LYGKNLEGNWEEKSVNNYFNALKTSSEFDVDKDKLLDKVYDLLAQRDKKVLELKEGSLAAIAKSLRQQDMVESASFPIISLDRDEVQSLIEGMLPPREYIKKFEDIFSVEKKAVENPGRKQGINENVLKIVSPYSATFPKSRIRPCDEKAVDMYVKHWNSQRMLKNQQYKISWSPLDNETVTFKLGTR
jgi:hypothetical protein